MPFRGIKPKYQKAADLDMVRRIMNAPVPVVGYTAPQQRAVVKRLMDETQDFSEKQRWDYWENLWKRGKSFEEQNLAVYFWSHPKNYELAKRHHKKLLAWAADLNNWAHSDGMSSLYARFLEDLGRPVDQILVKWNSSKNPWLRRQSVVSLLYYTRHRKKTPSAQRVLGALKPLLKDEHYYVQKGVGWTLREVYQVDAKLTMAFIERHLHEIDPRAYSAAVEKVSLAEKNRLRELRSTVRKARRP
ncbi:MAG TPA: DNA alkylation repair protein [Bdellovibrionota bacterium]|jgi:3-methyladenine DNA glycosylase AlkD|nr:DNA alkylation repair protein [Bdellovibrionota bacterium]